MRLLHPFLSLLALATLATLSGCATGSEASADREASAAKDTIRLGMSPEEVREVLGEPDTVRKPEGFVDDEDAVEWIFHLSLTAFLKAKPVDAQMTPFVDPFTGEFKEIVDPINRAEMKDVRRTVSIYFVGNEVAGWTVEDVNRLRYE